MTVVDLIGSVVPRVRLPSTQGGDIDLSALQGPYVLVIYPYTGKPGVPDPEGWDDIPGAHGSTPQLKGYGLLHPQFKNLGVGIWGLSLNAPHWQAEFASRAGLPFALLSDERRALTAALQLITFPAGDRSFLRRRTLFIEGGRIVHDRRDIPSPADDAEQSLAWFQARAS